MKTTLKLSKLTPLAKLNSVRRLEKTNRRYIMTQEERRIYNHDYYIANKEKSHDYYIANKEKRKEYYKEYNRNKYQMFAYVLPEEKEMIENYYEAQKDDFNGWEIHHRMELRSTGAVVDSSKQELINWGLYYNRPANELIFLKKEEHIKLHRGVHNNEKSRT